MADIKDINLLPYEERASERFSQLQKKLSLASIVFLAVAAIFTLATLILYTSLSAKRKGLIDGIAESSATINTYKKSEELLVVVASKISEADKILSSRTDYPVFFDSLSALIPQGVYFSDLKVTAAKVVASGKARTSADVAGLVSSLLSTEGTKLVSNLSVDSLNSDENGQYSFVISAQLTGAK